MACNWEYACWEMVWRGDHLAQTILSVIPSHERRIWLQYVHSVHACVGEYVSRSLHYPNTGTKCKFFFSIYFIAKVKVIHFYSLLFGAQPVAHNPKHIPPVHWQSDKEKKTTRAFENTIDNSPAPVITSVTNAEIPFARSRGSPGLGQNVDRSQTRAFYLQFIKCRKRRQIH